MTLEEARKAIGRRVVYYPDRGFFTVKPPERGVITSVNEAYVFVRYGDDQHSKATSASDLELEHGEQ